ncbi:MAG: hypothetical protein EAX86_09915 [Candidatus Heimdallarchaeota archaeon]|nr:hypothetical protein [Candidatus Heimdallarchaeota archaeon]
MVNLELFIYILKQICFGSLISGLIIFFLTLFVQGSHLFDHDADFDHDLGHDVSIDHAGIEIDSDVDIDADMDVDVDSDVSIGLDKDLSFHIDKDVGIDKDISHDISSTTPTPLMLLLGTFMITFGGSGMIFLDSGLNPILSIVIIIILPIGVTYVTSKAWGKLAVEEIYETALQTIKVDDQVKTLTNVDIQGGLVLIKTSSIHGPSKMAAKTKYGVIAKDMTAYVADIKGNILIIDEWPSSDSKERPIPEGSIKWD